MFMQILEIAPKLINYILMDPDLLYTKKQLALGAEVAVSTLDYIISDLVELDLIIK